MSNNFSLRIVTQACVMREMSSDTAEENLLEEEDLRQELEGDCITFIKTSDGWTEWRDNLAQHIICGMLIFINSYYRKCIK